MSETISNDEDFGGFSNNALAMQFFDDEGNIHTIKLEEVIEVMCAGIDQTNNRFEALFERLEETQKLAVASRKIDTN